MSLWLKVLDRVFVLVLTQGRAYRVRSGVGSSTCSGVDSGAYSGATCLLYNITMPTSRLCSPYSIVPHYAELVKCLSFHLTNVCAAHSMP
jgi:hypothetical protein